MKMFVFFQLVAVVLVLSFQHSFVDSTSCQSANWWRSFDRRGWSVCPTAFPYITGLWRNRAQSPAKDYIYLLEQARCCQSSDEFKNQPKICVHANWVSSFDRTKTWSKCPTGYFLNGLYRSNGNNLHNIEYASCCKPRNHPSGYKSCYNENVWSKFDYNRKGLVSCSKPGHYITGLYRSTCDFMYCIEEFQCCSMAATTTSCKSTTCLNGGKCTNHGSTFKCTCAAGFTGVRCEKEAQGSCSATGDPHYRTFDGKKYNFMGRCQYVLAKDSGNTFVVLQKNEPCGRTVTCANSVTVTVKGLKIHVPRGGQVTVFGIVVNLPYRNKGVEIIRLGGHTTKITTDVGLTVQYDGVYNVFVTVFARYKGKTLGLCGNFNGNPNDDFKTKDNQLTGDANVFADSWKVDRSCPNPPPPQNPCLKAGSVALEARKKCALLKGQPFSQCHNSVQQEASFIQDCEYDVCACKDHPISCLCEEYSAYVSSCALVGVNIQWKHLAQFKLCVSPCAVAPCLNGGKCTNHGSNFKCTCPSGFIGVRCETKVQSTCSATGDPHYKTFDGRKYNFMGKCQYVLAKDSANTFEVLAKNTPCNGRHFSCVHAITVTVKGLKIHIAKGGHTTVFGIAVNLPYNKLGVNIAKYGGRTVKITTDIGLTVQYDGVYNVFVTVSGRYKGKTLGLCGNYNGNPNDDFRLKQSNQITGNAYIFSNSWKVHRSCPNEPQPPNPCIHAGSVALEAKKKCALLKRQPFSQCHNSVHQDANFIRDCEYDVCACNNHPVSCLCEEFAAYVTTCALVNVLIKWKHLPAFKECSLPCAAGPCENGGACSNRGNDFVCECFPGYSGKKCETRTCKNPKALGMENGKIHDSQITASSQWNVNYGPTNARLNFKPKGSRTGAWSARRNDVHQWLQVDFKYKATLTEILTQGRNGWGSQWVKSYTVSYSNDGVHFTPYRKGGLTKVFQGNMNRDSIVRQALSPVILARYIRIHPKTWYGHISMRAEFHGCFEDQPCAKEPCLNSGECEENGDSFKCKCLAGYNGNRCENAECKEPLCLGMQDGEILDSQITASSEWNANYGPTNARLNFKPHGGKTGAWSSRYNNRNQWLQVDFELQATVTEIQTQGRNGVNQWVTSYTVSYSNDGIDFKPYRHGGVIKVFLGNRNRDTVVKNSVSPVIVARYIRIHPRTWYGHISMRAEFRGCLKELACASRPCKNGGLCIDYRGDYVCSCATGYGGKNCEVNIGGCLNKT